MKAAVVRLPTASRGIAFVAKQINITMQAFVMVLLFLCLNKCERVCNNQPLYAE
jgi:hypothetical protein